jgi:hypothetical protein
LTNSSGRSLDDDKLASKRRDGKWAPTNGISFDGRELGRWYDFCCWPILLQKSFSGDERNFLGLLMRFVCGDVRGLMVSHKIDHGPAHRRYRALQQWRRLKICFREIFGIVRFSTFATLSAQSGREFRQGTSAVEET